MNLNLQKLVIVDGMGLLFRCFYGIGKNAGLSLPDGTPVWGTYGFLRIFFKILKDVQANHAAIAWDLKGPTFRHEMYPHYKANRSAPPPELIPQIGLTRKACEDLGFFIAQCPGFEGDDCAGTLSQWYTSQGGKVLILTADKDFMQLVNDHVSLISLKSGDDYECIDQQGVIDYFGTDPEHVVDVLSLIGDSSDNVPGVKGIGPKGAAKLIQEFGDIDNLYKNISKVTNKKTNESLVQYKDDAHLSKKLVTINRDVPIENLCLDNLKFSWNHFSVSENTLSVLKNLHMISIIKTFEIKSPAGEGHSDSQLNKNEWGNREYITIKNDEEIEQLIQKISSNNNYFAIDTETTGLDHLESMPIGISFCFEAQRAYYLPIHEKHLQQTTISIDKHEIKNRINCALKTTKSRILAHNIKFDMHMLENFGIKFRGDLELGCTMIASWLLDSSANSHGLDSVTSRYLGLEKIPTSELIETKKSAKKSQIGKDLLLNESLPLSMLDVSLDKLTEYACEDVDATFRLWGILKPELVRLNLMSVFDNIEMPLTKVILSMERHGIYIDSQKLAELRELVAEKIEQTRSVIFSLSGEEFNVSSPKQLGHILFEKLKIQEGRKIKLQKTSLGFKTDISVLEQFQDHPLVSEIMKYRELTKLQSTYITVLPQLVKDKTNRVHTHFHQIGTATGRLSSSDPNLQNIPVRTDLGKKIREVFCAQAENTILTCVDYSQIELRVLAHLSQDENMISAFQKGQDIHKETAAKINNVTPNEVSSEMRNRAKAINFGIIYGMGAQRLSKEQKISFSDARLFIEKYFINFPRIREFIDAQVQTARQQGFVKTVFGRKRTVYGLNSNQAAEVKNAENIAVNTPIQGTAADIMKLGMIKVFKRLSQENMSSRILLQVHDELVLEGPIEESSKLKDIVTQELEGAAQFIVPLTVSVGQGKDWISAK